MTITTVVNTPSDQIANKTYVAGLLTSYVEENNPYLAYQSKTADYTLTAIDYTVDFTANNCIATLPTAVGITGRIYQINNSGNGTVTINTTSSQTISGLVSGAIKLLQNDQLTVQSTGSNWLIIH